MSEYLQLSYWQVALAAMLILLNALISLRLQLRLERPLLFSSLRMTLQLLLVGLILQWVFALRAWYFVVALMAVMTVIAGVSAVQRTEYRFAGMWWCSIISVWASSWSMTAFALFAVLQNRPWYQPQYAIPLLGMILGNTLSGISLGLDRFTMALRLHRDEVETRLALGATSWEAARPSVRDAVRTAMVPTLNAMAVTGIVSLPGMMTGQILAGVSPLEAVKYQLVIMFLIAAGTNLGAVLVVLFSWQMLFTRYHQLGAMVTQDSRKASQKKN